MKNTRLNFFNHKFQWLVLLVALLGVSQGVWGLNAGGIWYFDNTKTNWTDVYIIIGKSNWTQAVKLSANSCGYYVHNESGWGDASKLFFADNNCGYDTGNGSNKNVDSHRSGNYTENVTTNKSNYLCQPNSASGESIGITWSSINVLSVLRDCYVCFYAGVNNGWDTKKVYLNNGSSDVASDLPASAVSVGGTTYNLAPVCLPAGQYYISNQSKSGWVGVQMGEVSVAGKIYGLTNDGGNKVTINIGITPGALKFDNSTGGTSKTVSVGDAITLYASSNKSKDPYNSDLEVQYYVETSAGYFTLLGSGDISSNYNTKTITLPNTLTDGTYTIYALVTDKTNHKVYIKESNTVSLTISSCTPAPTQGKTITIKETSSGSFDDAVTVCSGTNVTVRVASAQSGYIYRVHSSSEPTAQNKLAEGSCTSAGNFDISFEASSSSTCYVFALKSNGCDATDVGNNTVSLTVNTTPTITPSSTTAKNFESVTLGSDPALNSSVGDNGWEITNISGSDSYLYNTTTTAAKFKGTVGGSSSKGFIIQGTASNGCVGSTTITVSADAEEICN